MVFCLDREINRNVVLIRAATQQLNTLVSELLTRVCN